MDENVQKSLVSVRALTLAATVEKAKSIEAVNGNVAAYKVLNLEMLLYKVRWHVSIVKECNLTAPILTLRSRTHSRNVIARVLAIDRACCAGASKRSLPA